MIFFSHVWVLFAALDRCTDQADGIKNAQTNYSGYSL